MLPLSISYREIDPSPGLDDLVRECTHKLEDLFERIERCDVVIERPHRRQQHGQRIHVRVHVAIPGRAVDVSSTHDLDPALDNAYNAVRTAFRAARRQLEDRRSRREVRVKEAT